MSICHLTIYRLTDHVRLRDVPFPRITPSANEIPSHNKPLGLMPILSPAVFFPYVELELTFCKVRRKSEDRTGKG